MSDFVTYAHVKDPTGVRFRDVKGGEYPKWAVDIRDYIEDNKMSKKLLNDVASILADVGVSYQCAEGIASLLTIEGHLSEPEAENFVETASNAPSVGECGC